MASASNAQTADVGTIDQTEIVPYLNSKSIVPALKVVTGNHLVSVDSQNREFISAVAGNGLQFEVHFHGCRQDDPRKCRAMSMLARWPSLKKSDAKKLSRLAPEFLRSNPLINSGIAEDNSPYVTRYVIADYGTAQGNLLSEFANFIRVASTFNKQMIDSFGQ